MLKWVIVVTFSTTGFSANEPSQYTRTEHAVRTFTQAVVDKQGRTVLFDDKRLCDKVAQQVIDNMLRDPAVRPERARCIQATVESAK